MAATFTELFTPKLVTVRREGYRLRHLRADAISGLTVAIVALPLSMAIAIASGLSPDRGLYTAIIGGFLVSALGGSRFQVGGPAGAFIVLVAATVARHGVDGLILATMMSGFILMAAPLAYHIPLAALAGVLAFVAWNMFDRLAFAAFLRGRGGDAVVLLATLLLTIFRDLTEAIVAGFALGAVLFIHRMGKLAAVESHSPFVAEDVADSVDGRTALGGADPDPVIHRVKGAFFFGAAGIMDSVLDRIGDTHRALVPDFDGIPFLDSPAVNSVKSVVAKARKQGVRVYVSGTGRAERREMANHGILPRDVTYKRDAAAAVAHWRGTAA